MQAATFKAHMQLLMSIASKEYPNVVVNKNGWVVYWADGELCINALPKLDEPNQFNCAEIYKIATVLEGDVSFAVGTSMVLTDSAGAHVTVQNCTTDLPYTAQTQYGDTLLTIQTSEMERATKRVLYAISKDLGRTMLCNIAVVRDSSDVSFVTTDGHRLANTPVIAAKVNESEGISFIPGAATKALRYLGQHTISLSASGLQTEEVTMSWSEVPGSYPDFKKVLPKSYSTILHFHTSEVIKSLTKLLKLSSSAKDNTPLCVYTNRLLRGDAEVPFTPDTHAYIDPKHLISFNPKYVLELLKLSPKTMCKMSIRDDLSPVKFTFEQEEQEYHIIVPVRV